MKQTISLVMAIAIMGMASCGNSSKDANGSDSTVVIEEVDTLRSPDLSMFFLQGPVKNVITQTSEDGRELVETDRLEFDKEGRLIGFYCWTSWNDGFLKIIYANKEEGEIFVENGKNEVERDEMGRICSLYTEPDNYFGRSWSYKKGRPYEHHISLLGYETSETFTSWDEKRGLPLTMNFEESGRGMSEKNTKTYTYTKFDVWGNYTEREIVTYGEHTDYDLMMIDDDESNDEETTPITTKSTEHRIITYYE